MQFLHSPGPRSFGCLAILVLAIITSIPQLYLCYKRGSDWNGGFVYLDSDEFLYSGYVNALVNGRPRRADPLTGKDDSEFENLYSVQFLPPYAVALTARAFHLSARAMFLVLLPLVSLASGLIIFWMFAELTQDRTLGIVGMLGTLCLGTLAAYTPREFFAQGGVGFFPFLRRYQPAVAFPIFFGMFMFAWRTLTRHFLWAIPAAGAFVILIYSYFFLWTAAAAWLFIISLLWFIQRREDRRILYKAGLIIAPLATLAFIPYVWLLHHRAPATDKSYSLEMMHTPDLFRAPELYCLLIIITLIYQVAKRKASAHDPKILFVASFSLSSLVLFNQQIVTGYSLQPFHYSHFVTNYWTVLAGLLLCALLWRSALQRLSWFIVLSSLIIGLTSAIFGARSAFPTSWRIDRGLPLLSRQKDAGTVFASDLALMHALPGVTSNPPLWAQHLFTFSNVDLNGQKKRFYQYLYYRGCGEQELREALRDDFIFRAEVFGEKRANTAISADHNPITQQEIDQAAKEYAAFGESFNSASAHAPTLSYAIVSPGDDLSRLNRWYELQELSSGNDLILYQLKLKMLP